MVPHRDNGAVRRARTFGFHQGASVRQRSCRRRLSDLRSQVPGRRAQPGARPDFRHRTSQLRVRNLEFAVVGAAVLDRLCVLRAGEHGLVLVAASTAAAIGGLHSNLSVPIADRFRRHRNLSRLPSRAARLKKLNSRERWIGVLEKFARTMREPATKRHWAPQFECATRGRIREVQEEKLAAMIPYLYEHSPFYRAKFKAAKLKPADIRTLADLPKFPVTTKAEMALDVAARPPWGTYTPIDERTWRNRSSVLFSTS